MKNRKKVEDFLAESNLLGYAQPVHGVTVGRNAWSSTQTSNPHTLNTIRRLDGPAMMFSPEDDVFIKKFSENVPYPMEQIHKKLINITTEFEDVIGLISISLKNNPLLLGKKRKISLRLLNRAKRCLNIIKYMFKLLFEISFGGIKDIISKKND